MSDCATISEHIWKLMTFFGEVSSAMGSRELKVKSRSIRLSLESRSPAEERDDRTVQPFNDAGCLKCEEADEIYSERMLLSFTSES